MNWPLLTMYAIAVQGTDKFLPAINQSRGFSNSEPEHNGGALGPRLFTTRKRAAAALAAWKIGPWEPVWDDVGESGHLTYEKVRGEPKRDPKRAEVPLVIVELALVPQRRP